MWVVPEFISDWQPSYCHIFSGAFEGWSRAVEWMRYQFGIGYIQSISIDHDEDVMKIWSIRNNAGCERPPFKIGALDGNPITGILANVREHSWINKCLCLTNLWFTISPPCISWSLGGRSDGLQHDAGMSFIFAIDKIKKVRPVGITGECADVTPKHPHCKIVKALMTYAGYKLVWDSVEPLHLLSPMTRYRWLFVWVRNDVLCTNIPKSILLKEQPVTSWNDEMYRFFIPDQISHQMKLGRRLLEIYGDASLLPPVKRNSLQKNPTQGDILRARCPDPNQPLPTLCASYTSQHLLSESHLSAKGIFAFLGLTAGEYHFFDPFRFCAFFGLPDSQFNDKVYEILLTVPGTKKITKASSGPTKTRKPAAIKEQEVVNLNQNDQINDRVSMLEAKFGNLERRQDVVENKLTSGFDQVQDQLRQILNAVGGRSDKSPTGSTPPPKFPKTA